MSSRNACSCLLAGFFAFTLALTTTASASHEKLLRVFKGTPAKYPSSGLIADPAGNLFGVTLGAVYELSPASGGGFTYHLLATMPGGYPDFAGGNLARDNSGNLYGATWQGGSSSCGYVYEVSPNPGNPWTFNVLYNFDCNTGAFASYALTLDAAGNLYGVTHIGGAFGYGIAYELSPGSGGVWAFKVLHDFSTAEGIGPQTGLIFDSAGNLYGVNESAVYKLAPNSDGTWTESTVYVFNSSTDGVDTFGDLMFDPAGNLYGTTTAAGQFGGGTAFELSPSGSGWTYTVLHAFGRTSGDGSFPYGGLTRDAAGNIYGTTPSGGGPSNAGTVFKLSLVGGVWQESILYRFTGSASNDGASPQSTLYLHSNSFFGTTASGGNLACDPNAGGCGIVFSLR